MKISIKQYDRTVTIENEHDDVQLGEALDMVEEALLATGYSFERGSLQVDISGPHGTCRSVASGDAGE